MTSRSLLLWKLGHEALLGANSLPATSIDQQNAPAPWRRGQGLNYLHTRNPPVVHRDIKGVRVPSSGRSHRRKLLDFCSRNCLFHDVPRLCMVWYPIVFLLAHIYFEATITSMCLPRFSATSFWFPVGSPLIRGI